MWGRQVADKITLRSCDFRPAQFAAIGKYVKCQSIRLRKLMVARQYFSIGIARVGLILGLGMFHSPDQTVSFLPASSYNPEWPLLPTRKCPQDADETARNHDIGASVGG